MNTNSELRSLSVEELDAVSGAEYKQLFAGSIGSWKLVVFTDDGHLGLGLEHTVNGKTTGKVVTF